MSKQIGNRSISQKGLQPNLLFTIGPAPENSKPIILKAKLENEPAPRQITETQIIKETKTKPILRSTGSKSPTPIKGGSRVNASPDTSMISQKSTAKGKFFKGEETPASKKVGQDSRSSSKEAPRLLSNKTGLEVKSHMDSKNSLSTRDESVDKGPKRVQKKTYDVLFEFSEEESAPQKARSKSPIKENLDPTKKKPTNMINSKPSVTPKEEPERDRSSTKKSVIQSRPSKYFESEETENNNSKKIDSQENLVSADDIHKKLQILRRVKGLKKADSKTELIIDHALRNKISDELILGSTGKTPKNFALKGVVSPKQKNKTNSQTEQSLKALVASSIGTSKEVQPKTHLRRESSPTNRVDLSFAVDKARLSAKKINLRSPNLFGDDKILTDPPNPKMSMTPSVSKSTNKIIQKKEIRDTSFDSSMISPRITEKAKFKTLKREDQEPRQSINKSPILNQSQVLTSQSTTSLKFKKEIAEKSVDKQNNLFQTSTKKEEAVKSRTSTAKKLKKAVEEEACDKTTIQPSKNSDFFFQMNFFKPIEESKLDEFIQNVNDTKTKQTVETEPSAVISPRMDHRSSLSSRPTSSKLNSSSLTPRDIERSSKVERERPDKEKIERLEKERAEKLEKERIQKEKLKKEKAERLEREKAEKDKAEKEKAEKVDKDKPEPERKAREKVAEPKEKAERDKTSEKDKDKSPDVSRLNLRLSKDFHNVAKLPKSKSPSHRIESMPVKQGLISRDNVSSTKDLSGKNELVTTETYSRLDQLLQELKSNIDKSQILDVGEDNAEKGLFSSENASESSSTTYSVNKSFAKNLIAFGNL